MTKAQKPIIFSRIEYRQPKWGHKEEKTKTNNKDWKMGLFMIFEDYQGNEYDYMPKWKEIDELKKSQYEIEIINSFLASKNQK